MDPNPTSVLYPEEVVLILAVVVALFVGTTWALGIGKRRRRRAGWSVPPTEIRAPSLRELSFRPAPRDPEAVQAEGALRGRGLGDAELDELCEAMDDERLDHDAAFLAAEERDRMLAKLARIGPDGREPGRVTIEVSHGIGPDLRGATIVHEKAEEQEWYERPTAREVTLTKEQAKLEADDAGV